jgi:hypothetical protein
LSDFITNGASVLPAVKSDVRVPTGGVGEWAADDSNKLRQAALDLRSQAILEAANLVLEQQNRLTGDALIIASGVTPSNVNLAPVTATGTLTARTLADRAADTVNVKDFGAKGDATFDKSYNAWSYPYGILTGTDDTAAIQAAIDYAIANRKGRVVLPSGVFRITAPFVVDAAGGGINKLDIVGDGMMYAGEAPFGGTAIIADFDVGNAIELRTARTSSVQRLTLVGRNWAFLADTGPADSGILADWVEPSLVAGGVSDVTTNPYCGIAVNDSSSNVLLRDVEVRGFIVGLGVAMDGTTTQGDFVGMDHCKIESNKYAVSVGNAQSRLVNANNSSFFNSYTAISSARHGAQNGRLGGIFNNCSFDSCHQIIDAPQGAVMGGITFTNCYAELLGKVGVISSSAVASAAPATFKGCMFVFLNPAESEIPLEYISSESSPVLFDSCYLQTSGPFSYGGGGRFGQYVSFANGTIVTGGFDYPAVEGNDVDTVAFRLADRGMSRVFPRTTMAYFAGLSPGLIYMGNAEVDTYTTGSERLTLSEGNGRVLPYSAWRFKDTPFEKAARVVASILDVATTPLTVSSHADAITWALDFSTHLSGEGAKLIRPGDLAYDKNTGARFRIVGISGTVVTVQMVTGFSRKGGSLATSITPTFNAGEWFIYCSRVYSLTNSHHIWGDFTASNNVITNVCDADGNFTYKPTAGDWLLSHTYLAGGGYYGYPYGDPYDPWFTALPQVVTTGANSITLDANAAQTQLRVPIGLWIRDT